MKQIIAIGLVSFGLVACGGGSSGGSSNQPSQPETPTTPTNPTTPEDSGIVDASGKINTNLIYSGDSSQGQKIVGLFDKNKNFWFVYSAPYSPQSIAGTMTGKTTLSAGSIAANETFDHYYAGATNINASMKATFDSNKLTGGITYTPSNVVNFSLTKDSTLNAKQSSLVDITGNYKGTSAITIGTETANVVIKNDGSLTGTTQSNCSFTGTVNPEANTSYFNMTLKFNGSPCQYLTESFTGVAYFDAKAKSLHALSVADNSRYRSVLFVGTKQ